jgi:hypothetical protein
MALSLDGPGKPQFLALGYLDDELFLHYDGESYRAEPSPGLALRSRGQLGAEAWARETEDLQDKEQQLRKTLAEIMGQEGQDGGECTKPETDGSEL